MYHDFAGREIEDLEMDNMRRDAREQEEADTLNTLDLNVSWENGTLHLETPEWEGELDAGQTMQLLEYLYKHRNEIFRTANDLPEQALPTFMYSGPVYAQTEEEEDEQVEHICTLCGKLCTEWTECERCHYWRCNACIHVSQSVVYWAANDPNACYPEETAICIQCEEAESEADRQAAREEAEALAYYEQHKCMYLLDALNEHQSVYWKSGDSTIVVDSTVNDADGYHLTIWRNVPEQKPERLVDDWSATYVLLETVLEMHGFNDLVQAWKPVEQEEGE